jgi:hypothetical protein
MKYIYFKTFEKLNTDNSSSNKYFGSVVTTRFMDRNQNYQSAIRISFTPEKFVDSDGTTLYDNGFRIKSISYINKSDYNNTFSVYDYSNQTSSTSSDS